MRKVSISLLAVPWRPPESSEKDAAPTNSQAAVSSNSAFFARFLIKLICLGLGFLGAESVLSLSLLISRLAVPDFPPV